MVSPAELFRLFRLGDNRYQGKVVQCHLDAGSYRLGPGRIEAYCITDRSCCVYFESTILPRDTDSPLTVAGRCFGKFTDGEHRAFGVNWFVRVTDSSVSLSP